MRKFFASLLLVPLLLFPQVIENFLNSTYVHRLYEYEDKIYSATSGGVAIFDKTTSSFDRLSVGDGLASNDVRDVIYDKYGNLWFVCYGEGLSILSPGGRWKKISGDWYGLPDEVLCINIISDTVLVGTNTGLRVWDIETEDPMEITRRMEMVPSYPGDVVNRIQYFRDSLFISTDRGVGIVALSDIKDGSLWNNITEVSDVQGVWPSGDTLWIAGTGGIFRAVAGEISQLGTFNSRDITAFRDSLWLATSRGLKVWNGTAFLSTDITVNSRSLLPSASLWVGTWGKGIAEYSDTVSYFTPSGPAHNQFREIALDSEGNLWAITGHFLVSRFDIETEEWSVFNQTNEWDVEGGGLRDLAVGRDGMIWLGVWNWNETGPGVIRLSPEGILDTLFRFPMSNVISDIAIDRRGDVWISVWRFPLYRIRSGSLDSIEVYGGTKSFIRRIAFDRDGTVLLGYSYLGPGGVFRLVDGDVEEIRCPEIQGEDISSLAVDLDGRIWVGTPAGIFIIRGEKIERRLIYEDAVDRVADDILLDVYGNVWLLLEDTGVKEGGALRVTRDFQFLSIMSFDGLVSGRIDRRKASRLAYDRRRDWFWIATDEGITRYRTSPIFPDRLIDIQVFPNPYIEGQHTEINFFSEALTGGSIKIYSLSGRLIKSFRDIENGTLRWDVPDLASGVYIYLAKTEDGHKRIGKFAVIQ